MDPAFRLDQALEQAGGEELLSELVGIVLEQGPEHLVAALSARERGDAPVLEAATHKLRGAVTIFGAASLRRALEEAERAARRGSLGECSAPLARAESEWKTLARELEVWLALQARRERKSP